MMPLWDKDIANTSAAITQAMNMGGVVIKTKPKAGFAPPQPPQPITPDPGKRQS